MPSVVTDAASHKQASVPKLKRVQTIDLRYIDLDISVNQLAFSLDGRYLAILLWPAGSADKVDIVVWGMQKGKAQSRIHYLQDIESSDENLLWSRDGKQLAISDTDRVQIFNIEYYQ